METVLFAVEAGVRSRDATTCTQEKKQMASPKSCERNPLLTC